MTSGVSSIQVEVVFEEGLAQIHQQWEMLSTWAIEPNLFYEPWMLLPALEILERRAEARFVLIWYRDPAHANAEPLLVGFFPFIVSARLKGLPVSVIEILTHIYFTLGVPLIRRGFSKPVLEVFIDWLNSRDSNTPLASFTCLPCDGAFHQSLLDLLYARSLVSFVEQRYTRALYRCVEDQQVQSSACLSNKFQKQIRKKRESLAGEGKLEFRQLTPQDDLICWTNAFLQLEASGWKGVAGTALASSESHVRFFRNVTDAAHKMKRLSMSGLWLDGRMIAGCTGFWAGNGLYLLKIAFDERYSKYSPGVLLQIEWMSRGYDGAAWVDCCTTANNPVFPRIWIQRRTMENLVVSAGALRGDLVLSVLPGLIFAKRRLERLWGLVSMKRKRSKHEENTKSRPEDD